MQILNKTLEIKDGENTEISINDMLSFNKSDSTLTFMTSSQHLYNLNSEYIFDGMNHDTLLKKFIAVNSMEDEIIAS